MRLKKSSVYLIKSIVDMLKDAYIARKIIHANSGAESMLIASNANCPTLTMTKSCLARYPPMTKNLHCPHCDNIIHRYTEQTTLNAVLYCRKCKREWQTVIANGKVYEMEEALGRD